MSGTVFSLSTQKPLTDATYSERKYSDRSQYWAGFLAGKGDGEPGVKTIWPGLRACGGSLSAGHCFTGGDSGCVIGV